MAEGIKIWRGRGANSNMIFFDVTRFVWYSTKIWRFGFLLPLCPPAPSFRWPCDPISALLLHHVHTFATSGRPFSRVVGRSENLKGRGELKYGGPNLPPPPVGIGLTDLPKSAHGMFLERWNPIKSLSNIWQCFSCLLDEEIAKICKKMKSHNSFFFYLQDRTANLAHLAAIFCPVLVCPQNPPWELNFFHIFGNPSSSCC